MSLVANIQIYDCDECKAMISLKNNDDFKAFKGSWFCGIRYQFCPACSVNPATRIRRGTEQQFMDAIAECSDEQLKEAWPDYVH